MMALKILAAVAIGYFLGSSNLAYYIAKAKKVDMRGEGTGNYGTSNAFVLMGAKIGVLVAIHDIAKTVISVILTCWLFPDIKYIGYVAGAASVIGHIFPFYIKFKGGKGFASYLGMAVALNWKFGLVIVVIIVAAIFITNYMVAGTMITILSTPLWSAFYQREWIGATVIGVVSLIIILKHIENFVKIVRGTEFKVRDVIFKRKKNEN